MARRAGASLIEVLLVIGILSMLTGITVPAIFKARENAVRLESANQMRQIGLAVHTYTAERRGKLPSVTSSWGHEEGPLFFAILPYLGHGPYHAEVMAGTRPRGSAYPMPQYISPADPTADRSRTWNVCSYPANFHVFRRRPDAAKTFRDGTAHTIAFAEHYAFPQKKTQFSWFEEGPPLALGDGKVLRRATFTDFVPGTTPYDANVHDVYPLTSGNPLTSVGSVPGLTFQVRPREDECDPRIPQTPHGAGMLVIMGDGSTRTLRGGMEPTVFWALVTPAGLESVSNID